MEITLDLVDQVRERTGASYEEAKAALEAANGNVVDAIIEIERENGKTIDLNEKIRSAVRKGNVNRIRVMRGDEEMLNIPVSVGIAGGLLGLMAGPGVVLTAAVAAAVAKFGFDCRFELVKEDGSVEEIIEERCREDEAKAEECVKSGECAKTEECADAANTQDGPAE